MKKLLLFTVFLTLCFPSLGANELIHSDYDNYFKYLELTGRAESPFISYQSFSNNDWQYLDSENPWMSRMGNNRNIYSTEKMSIAFLDPEILFTANSLHQYGMNDGAMWQGKGLNGRLQAGISFKSKYVDITFYPQIWFAQNLEYEIMPTTKWSDFGYFMGNIDLVQRMGDSAIFQFDFGQTDLRFNFKKFTFGFSTEEIWLGPSRTNGLILSNNSAGLPHFDIGFRKIDTKIGSFEGRFVWGLLRESDYFNDDPEDDLRLFSLATAAFNIKWLPGLNVGFNWSAQTPGGDFEARDFFILPITLFISNSDNNYNDNDQKVSITFDWKFPKVGFEIYGELGWEDFNSSFLQIPDHTLFYTLGGFYVIPINEKRGLILNFEHTDLGVSDTQEIIFDTHSVSNYYTHHIVTQGYGNIGQVLGAGIGPGSDSQFASIKYYDSWGSVELFAFRHNKNKTYIYNDVTNSQWDLNVEFSVGLNNLFFIGPFDINTSIVVTGEMAAMYTQGNDQFNFHGELGFRYKY
ncbi:MAG: hypothetical protein PF518_16315 [Spirochaetaceae bacterium]|jgi:hypothetical protein|nr:hypothetical protein [Spirochaetaceae bacterium]